MSSEIRTDLIKDKSNTKTLATLSSSAVTLHDDVVLPSGSISNYIGQTTQPSGEQLLTINYATITGALISSYTPTTGASKVFYSINVRTYHVDDNRGIASFMLFLDGVNQGAESGFTVDCSTATSFGDYITYHTLISTSGWTSGKNVELKARVYSDSYNVGLHRNANHHAQDGGSDSVMYNKVHTIIYSIM
tara:strand:+ start:2110 stop:2682 length:573 start_codon:yes stop_codon:yes gene_type:complete